MKKVLDKQQRCAIVRKLNNNMVSFNYKLKNGEENIRRHAQCFSTLWSIDFSKLEFIKYFIDSKLTKEETERYLKFLKNVFGENVSVVDSYPLITLTLNNFSVIDDFQRLIVILCFYRYLDETHEVLEKTFKARWKTDKALFKALLNSNLSTRTSVNPNHQLIDTDGRMKYSYKNVDKFEVDFSLDNFKQKFFSGEKHIKGWGFFLKNLG